LAGRRAEAVASAIRGGDAPLSDERVSIGEPAEGEAAATFTLE
jgi:hypothetical protein